MFLSNCLLWERARKKSVEIAFIAIKEVIQIRRLRERMDTVQKAGLNLLVYLGSDQAAKKMEE